MSDQNSFNTPVAACPGCGAPVEFKVGSARVLVCARCRSLVARTDRGLETIGKVADLVPTGARLALGQRGSYQGTPFQLAGRIQMEWEQGVWDEWYAAFDDGRFAWIAEAQGRYTLTFRHSKRALPPFAKLAPGQELQLERLGRFVVADLKQARYRAASGELPERVPLGGPPVPSADLSGRDGAFATIDYSDPEDPQLYAGREVAYEALKLSTQLEGAAPAAPRIGAARVGCPKCGGSLELKAPDQARRVTCPYCSSLLDVDQGKLAYLKTIEKQQIAIPLGSRGRLCGTDWLLIGWLRRRCVIEGTAYYWEEYLLYDEKTAGFRFLVQSAGHWSFVEPLAAGDVEEGWRGVRWKGRWLKLFSETEAKVAAVLGEFYWAVEVGEAAKVRDYVSPPDGISWEANGEEINWSHATYLEPEEVAAAFGLKEPLARPQGVGMMQPNPHQRAFPVMVRWAGIACAAAIAIYVAASIGGHRRVYSGPLQANVPAALGGGSEPAPAAPAEHTPTADQPWAGAVGFSEPFKVGAGRNLEVEVTSNVDETWAFVGGELIRTGDDQLRSFYLETSYYHGVDDGESWSEGSRRAVTYLGQVEAGEYVLRGEMGWEPGKPRPELTIEVTSGVPRCSHLFLVFVVLLAFPVAGWIRAALFEKARWEESDAGD